MQACENQLCWKPLMKPLNEWLISIMRCMYQCIILVLMLYYTILVMLKIFFICQEKRKRIEERRKRREENEKKSQIVQVVCQDWISFHLFHFMSVGSIFLYWQTYHCNFCFLYHWFRTVKAPGGRVKGCELLLTVMLSLEQEHFA